MRPSFLEHGMFHPSYSYESGKSKNILIFNHFRELGWLGFLFAELFPTFIITDERTINAIKLTYS